MSDIAPRISCIFSQGSSSFLADSVSVAITRVQSGATVFKLHIAVMTPTGFSHHIAAKSPSNVTLGARGKDGSLPGDCMSTSLTSASPPAGPLLSFDVNDNTAFEIPLSNVSQCATGKNEVTLEFHQTDDTEVSLMEVRFYVPPSQSDERQDPVEVRAQY